MAGGNNSELLKYFNLSKTIYNRLSANPEQSNAKE